MKPLVRRVLAVAVAAAAIWYAARQPGLAPAAPTAAALPQQAVRAADESARAFRERAAGRVIHAVGAVERTLADDRDGSPHQRFIIRTDGGISLLIAHNIDLAPRLEGLARGERVEVVGEYVWNDKGGLMHWTHRDPGGRHQAGYIEWRGRRYQ
jgi:hypothetical protein